MSERQFARAGPCQEEELNYDAFEPFTLLQMFQQRKWDELVCRKCTYPTCVQCKIVTGTPVVYAGRKTKWDNDTGKCKVDKDTRKCKVCKKIVCTCKADMAEMFAKFTCGACKYAPCMISA